jgi:hypothetical protein
MTLINFSKWKKKTVNDHGHCIVTTTRTKIYAYVFLFKFKVFDYMEYETNWLDTSCTKL